MESVHSLLVVREGLSHCADDCGLGVATKSRLQNTSDFGISVADEVLGVLATTTTELIDNI